MYWRKERRLRSLIRKILFKEEMVFMQLNFRMKNIWALFVEVAEKCPRKNY
jgi:hypothetical protein